jgi:hypothetical protein
MLGFLTKKWRWRAASLLAVLYALCLVAPTAVLALSAQAAPAHCLTENTLSSVFDHAYHGDSNQNRSNSDHDGLSRTTKCCGLFLVNGVAPTIDVVAVRPPFVSQITALITTNLSAQDSDRIDRPPRILQSI